MLPHVTVGMQPGSWPIYIATVQTEEAALSCPFVLLQFTRGLLCQNLGREKEFSITDAILNNA